MNLHTISVAQALAALPAFPALRGRLASLRPPRETDAGALFALFADAGTVRHWSRPAMRAGHEAEGLLQEMHEAFASRSMLHWLVTRRGEETAIGTCALFHFDPRRRSAELGYALLPEYRGRGLAGDAVATALAWAFPTLGLRRVEAGVDPRNASSRRLLLRRGFSSEGVARGRLALGDPARDTEVFALSVDAWKRSAR